MLYRCCSFGLVGLLLAAGSGRSADSQPAGEPLAIRTIAQVELRSTVNGREITRLAPATRVASGEWIIYTLEVRNTSAATLPAPAVTFPIPRHMSYGADTAIGPGADVTYSVDGRHFDVPENLKIHEPGGATRTAAAAEYTHIRWQLKNPLKGNSVAFVRFRAQLK